jgi:hypothetical protein
MAMSRLFTVGYTRCTCVLIAPLSILIHVPALTFRARDGSSKNLAGEQQHEPGPDFLSSSVQRLMLLPLLAACN